MPRALLHGFEPGEPAEKTVERSSGPVAATGRHVMSLYARRAFTRSSGPFDSRVGSISGLSTGSEARRLSRTHAGSRN